LKGSNGWKVLFPLLMRYRR